MTFVVCSMLAATWVTLLMALMLTGAMEAALTEEAAAVVMGTLIMIPALIGLGLAAGSFDNRAGNPPIVWVTVVWNSILMAVWILLVIVGIMMGGA